MTRPLNNGHTKPDCFFCAENGMLAFAPLTTDDLDGYVIPGSRPVLLEGHDRAILTPMPFIYLLAPKGHPQQVDEFGGVWPLSWAMTERDLMRLIGFGGGHNLVENHGTAFGQRPVGNSADHLFKWVITERHLVPETPADKPSTMPGTQEYGFATKIHESRQFAGSIPDDTTLAGWWLDITARVGNTVAAWQQFNRRVNHWRLEEA